MSYIGRKVILVAQRGWVFMGDVAEDNDTEMRLENASVIRLWGTTKGLGQIALEGATSKTVLDPCGEVRVHPLAVVAIIPCKEGTCCRGNCS